MKVVDKTNFEKDLNIPKKSIIIDDDFNKRESFFVDKMQDGSKLNEAREANLKNKFNVNISSIPIQIQDKIIPTNIINLVLKDITLRYALLNGYVINNSIGFFHTDEMLKKNLDDSFSTPSTENEIKDNSTKNTKRKTDTKGLSIANLKKEVGLIEKNRINLENNIRKQIHEIMNLGVLINYSKYYYSTLRTDTSTKMLNKFQELYNMSMIHHEIRPVPWCTKCGQSLQQKDIKYRKSKVSNTYILYKVKFANEGLSKLTSFLNTYIVASTLRPWSVVTSSKLVVAKDTEYCIVQVEDVHKNITKYIMAKSVANHVMEDAFFLKYKIIETFDSSILENTIVFNPINEKEDVTIHTVSKEYVLIDKNTTSGINVLSQGYTYLDYLIHKKLNLDTNFKCVIDRYGVVNNLLPEYKGKNINEVNKEIINLLKEKNSLFLQTNAVLIIPRCKTCNSEVIYRDLNKWYIKRKEEDNEKIKTSFNNLLSRISVMEGGNTDDIKKSLNKILNSKELSISNERKSSVPIPAFSCAACGNIIINDTTIQICKDIIIKKGIDTWNKLTPDEILRGSIKCEKCGCDFFFKEDSSLNDAFKLLTIPMFHIQKDKNHPEYTATNNLNICIETKKNFLQKIKVSSFDTNAAVKINNIHEIMLHPRVNQNTSKANYDPLFGNTENEFASNLIQSDIGIIDIVKKYGIDVLRLWAIYRSNKTSIRLSEGDIVNIRHIYIKFRRTINYLLSNLYDFDPKKDIIPIDKRDSLDRYIYYKMCKLDKKLRMYYSKLNYRGIYKILLLFCSSILSDDYFEAARFRLYATKNSGLLRRSTQSTFYEIFELFVIYLGPILPLLFEEAWPFIQHKNTLQERNNLLFRKTTKLQDITLTQNELVWEKIFQVRKRVLPYIHKACNEKIIKTSLEASITIICNEEGVQFIKDNYENLVRTLNISEAFAKVGNKFDVKVRHAAGVACARCKNYSVNIGLNYKYRYLCPICAELEENMNKANFIPKEHLVFPKDPELVQKDVDLPPPPKFKEIQIDTNFENDRLGGNFDDNIINQKVDIPSNKDNDNNPDIDSDTNSNANITTKAINKDIINDNINLKTENETLVKDKVENKKDEDLVLPKKDIYENIDMNFEDDRLGNEDFDNFDINSIKDNNNDTNNLKLEANINTSNEKNTTKVNLDNDTIKTKNDNLKDIKEEKANDKIPYTKPKEKIQNETVNVLNTDKTPEKITVQKNKLNSTENSTKNVSNKQNNDKEDKNESIKNKSENITKTHKSIKSDDDNKKTSDTNSTTVNNNNNNNESESDFKLGMFEDSFRD